MSKLEPDAKAAVLSTDEIGALATNINNLYQSLLLTIRNLELEKEKVIILIKIILHYRNMFEVSII